MRTQQRTDVCLQELHSAGKSIRCTHTESSHSNPHIVLSIIGSIQETTYHKKTTLLAGDLVPRGEEVDTVGVAKGLTTGEHMTSVTIMKLGCCLYLAPSQNISFT